MILDLLSELSNEQAGAVFDVGDNVSTNIIDTEVDASNIGEGSPLYLDVSIGATAVDSAGDAATMAVQLQESADNSTWTDLLTSVVFAQAAMTAGAKLLRVAIPDNAKRYLRVNYLVAVADFTAGTVNAHIGIG